MIILPDSGGLEFLPLAPDPLKFSPPGSEEVEWGFLWGAQPDDFDDLPAQDREYVTEAWKAMGASFASVLSEIFYVDQLVSLPDFPTLMERRWVKYALEREIPFGPFEQLRVQQGGDRRGRIKPLPGPLPTSTTLRWQASVRLSTSTDSRQWLALGYGGPRDSGIYVALSNEGEGALVIKPPSGPPRWVTAPAEIEVDAEDFSVFAEIDGNPSGEDREVRVRFSWGEEEVLLSWGLEEDIPLVDFFVGNLPTTFSAPDVELLVGAEAEWELSDVRYLHPFAGEDVQALPLLKASPSDAAVTLRENVDYRLQGGAILFEAQPPETLWAPSVGVQMRMLSKMYAPFVGAEPREDSETYRNLIVGMLYGLLAGPYPGALAVAASAIAGTPICLEDGKVTAMTADDESRVIRVQGLYFVRDYHYPEGLKPLVSVGQQVQRLQPLTTGVQIDDWLSSTNFVAQLQDASLAEVQKYGAVRVTVPALTQEKYQAFSVEALRYLKRALPLWTSLARTVFVFAKSVRSSIVLSDGLRSQSYLKLSDNLQNLPDPRYNGDPLHLYDGSIVYGDGSSLGLQDNLVVSTT